MQSGALTELLRQDDYISLEGLQLLCKGHRFSPVLLPRVSLDTSVAATSPPGSPLSARRLWEDYEPPPKRLSQAARH